MSPVVAIGDPSPEEFSRVILETQHWKSTKLLCAVEVRDPRVPTSSDKAIVLPLWAAAITTELGKFRDHNCLIMTPYTGQHLVPMKWIFSIKTDCQCKIRLPTQVYMFSIRRSRLLNTLVCIVYVCM